MRAQMHTPPKTLTVGVRGAPGPMWQFLALSERWFCKPKAALRTSLFIKKVNKSYF